MHQPGDFPRVSLADLPTPLHRLERLSAELGTEVWAKRDDVGGLGLAGNKLRKLEFLLGDARRSRAAAVATFGAIQSNHARQTAAACARLGIPCHLVLTRSVDRDDDLYLSGGNVLLDHLFGATVHVCDDDDSAITAAIAAIERSVRGTIRWIPPGGSEPIGALGYVAMVAELADQCEAAGIQPTDVVVATSTGGTQAGLVCGTRLAAPRAISGVRVRGMAVYHHGAATTEAVELLDAGVSELLGVPASPPATVHVDDRHFGEGYGIPTSSSREAMEMFAGLEGIALDPVYTAKAAAGLIAGCRSGELGGSQQVGGTLQVGAPAVVFIHTGGTPALFAYG